MPESVSYPAEQQQREWALHLSQVLERKDKHEYSSEANAEKWQSIKSYADGCLESAKKRHPNLLQIPTAVIDTLSEFSLGLGMPEIRTEGLYLWTLTTTKDGASTQRILVEISNTVTKFNDGDQIRYLMDREGNLFPYKMVQVSTTGKGMNQRFGQIPITSLPDKDGRVVSLLTGEEVLYDVSDEPGGKISVNNYLESRPITDSLSGQIVVEGEGIYTLSYTRLNADDSNNNELLRVDKLISSNS